MAEPKATESSYLGRAADAQDEADPVVCAYLKDIDETLIRKNLALDVEERFRQLMELQAFRSELRRGGERANRS